MHTTVARSSAMVTVAAHVKDAPVTKASYMARHILPYQVEVEYVYGMNEWQADSVSVVGRLVLNPGDDGEKRVSERTAYEAVWLSSSFGRSAENSSTNPDPMPEWLVSLVDELRPSGHVALPDLKP